MDTTTTYVAPRTCTLVSEGEATRVAAERLYQRRGVRADRRTGRRQDNGIQDRGSEPGGTYVTVRDFQTFDDRPERHDTIFFLDGLDESRAGTEDGRTPLDDIRNRLDHLERPRFRLSCRWADWMAADRPLPIRAGRIRLDAPYFSHFVVQTLGPTSVVSGRSRSLVCAVDVPHRGRPGRRR